MLKTRSHRLLWPVLLFILLAGHGRPARAANDTEEKNVVNVVAIITRNDQGDLIQFPSTVTYDPVEEETYVITGGQSRIVVYDRRFIPQISFGRGRGIDAAVGLAVDRNGMVAVCQASHGGSPQRLTILNAAFLPAAEFTFDNFPGAASFTPQRIAIGPNGRFFIAGNDVHGVLVLDRQGKFLHWLTPTPVEDQTAAVIKPGKEPDQKTTEPAGEPAGDNQPDPIITETLMDLPPELIPKRKTEETEKAEEKSTPIRFNDLAVDSEGNLFLLSEDKGKIYVYDRDEKFLFSFGTKGGSAGKLSRPKGIAVDERHKAIYVVDYMRHTILVYNLAGKYMFEIGGRGVGPGWFNYPTDIAVNRHGQLIVTDFFNHRVQVLAVDFDNPSVPPEENLTHEKSAPDEKK